MNKYGMTGSYYHNLDAKGRVNFPAKLREVLGDSFWAVRSTGERRYLSIYSQEQWDALCLQIADLKGPQGEELRRWFFSGASELITDKQGRILVPQPLREYAGLEKDVVIIGAGRKAEIWNRDRWEAENNSFDPKTTEMLSELCL
jgi:MraZ protein